VPEDHPVDCRVFICRESRLHPSSDILARLPRR